MTKSEEFFKNLLRIQRETFPRMRVSKSSFDFDLALREVSMVAESMVSSAEESMVAFCDIESMTSAYPPLMDAMEKYLSRGGTAQVITEGRVPDWMLAYDTRVSVTVVGDYHPNLSRGFSFDGRMSVYHEGIAPINYGWSFNDSAKDSAVRIDVKLNIIEKQLRQIKADIEEQARQIKEIREKLS